MSKKVTVGINIGTKNTLIGIVDETGNVVNNLTIATNTKDNTSKFTEEMIASLKNLFENLAGAQISGIGITAPNANEQNGSIGQSSELAIKNPIPIVEILKKGFPEITNINLASEANALAISEIYYGGAKGLKNLIMVNIGPELEAGFVIDGKTVLGKNGMAGQLGHFTVTPEGRECSCGQFGHLDAYCSSTGMIRTALELLAHHNATESLLANKSFLQLTAKDLFEAAKKNDEIALTVYEITGDILGQALADAAHITGPEAIFLFGAPLAAGELLLKPIRESMENRLIPSLKNKIKLQPSQLRMALAPIVAASALALGHTATTE